MLMMYQLNKLSLVSQTNSNQTVQDDEATINVKQSDNETFQNSNTDEDFSESKVNDKEISPFIHTCTLNATTKH